MSAAAAQTMPTWPEPAQLTWTAEQWELARRLRLRSRRAQGLPDMIEDPLAIHQAGVLLRAVR